MGKVKLDDECKYKGLCEEMYGEDDNFKCVGTSSCEHYDAYFEGECVAIESEGMW